MKPYCSYDNHITKRFRFLSLKYLAEHDECEECARLGHKEKATHVIHASCPEDEFGMYQNFMSVCDIHYQIHIKKINEKVLPTK